MFLFSGRKSKIFLAVLIINGVFLFLAGPKTARAYHATSSYNKLFTDTLTSQNWNDLFGDFVNTWLPVSLNGPVGIATSSPVSGLEVNGSIRGSSLFSSGNVGFGTNNPLARLEVVPASGYSILAGNFKIGNVALPTADADAATKGYVDSFVASATSSMGTLWGGTPVGNIWNLNSGNVGIGTTTPGAKLEVAGIIQSKTGTNTGEYRIGGSAVLSSTATDGSLLRINGGGFSNVSIVSGNLGIGTTTPDTKLQVVGSGAVYGKIQTLSNASTVGLHIKNGTRNWFVGQNWGAVDSFEIRDQTSGGARFLINTSGNVGIGTTTPLARLEVVPTSGYSILAGNYKIGNVALPTVDSDAATKGYVDAFVASYIVTATGTIGTIAHYVGITPTAYTGDNNGAAGYATAQNACAAAFASSTVCTPDNILGSIAAGITLAAEDVWIFAGPPGYTAAANDCEGRSVATTVAYGTYWQIAMPGSGRPQGRGLLMKCNNALRIACCR